MGCDALSFGGIGVVMPCKGMVCVRFGFVQYYYYLHCVHGKELKDCIF